MFSVLFNIGCAGAWLTVIYSGDGSLWLAGCAGWHLAFAFWHLCHWLEDRGVWRRIANRIGR